MTKASDYCISRVRYNDQRTRIADVMVHENLGGRIGHGYRRSRAEVIAAMKAGKRIVTVREAGNGSWKVGAVVQLFRVRGLEYLRAYGNAKAEDNLGALPKF